VSKRLGTAALIAAAALALTPSTASAICWTEVGGICVSPCDLGNLAYRTVTGSDLTSC
jgi:hypothetical protein